MLNNRISKVLFLRIIIPVMIGTVLYFYFCPDVIFVGVVDDFLKTVFHKTISRTDSLPWIIRFYLFDFLWSYSFAGVMCFFFDIEDSLIPCIAIPVGFGIILEILQGVGIAAGTADVFDTIVEMAGVITAIIMIRRARKNEKTN